MDTSHRRRLALVLLTLPLVLGLTACGGSAETADKSAVPAGSTAGGTSDAGGIPVAAAAEDRAAGPERTSEPIERSVVATGSLRLASRQLADTRQDAINLVTGLGGHVGNEQARSDDAGRLDRVDLTVRVPSASFDKALDGLAALGTVRDREQSVEDVTTQVIDLEARVKAQRAAVESLERLLARAGTIAEIMSVERQLTERQAALDSLVQQQKWLADQTSLSTISLTLTRPAPADTDHAGFVGGLQRGWRALGSAVVGLLTALGAVLPFAAVAGLLALPVWALVRRRHRPATPSAAA